MPEQGKRLRWEGCLFVCAVTTALLLLWTMAKPLRTGHVPVVGDLGYFHLPLRGWYAECLERGCGFDWLPGMYNGVFISGEGEHGPYHPLHLLIYRFLALDHAFALEAFLPFPAMMLGMFLFLCRHIGRTAALFGALLYTFSANNLAHGSQVNYNSILAHLPWLLWMMDSAIGGISSVRRRLALLGIALLTGSQLLLGQPQAMSYSLLAEMLYGCFLVEPLRRPLRVGLPLLSAKLIGGLLGAVQLLATLDFLSRSTRTGIDPYFGSLPVALLLQLVSPALMRQPLEGWFYEAFYLGMVPIILALCYPLWAFSPSLAAEEAGGPRRVEDGTCLAWFAVVLGLLAGWLALGQYGGLYSLQVMLPLVKHFRGPTRYVNLIGFAAAILSAIVFCRLQERLRSGQPLAWRRLALPWLGVAATLVVALAFHRVYPHLDQRHLSSSFYAGPLLALAAAVALTAAGRGWRLGLFALLVLAVVDIDYFCLRGPTAGEPLWRYPLTVAEWEAHASPPPSRESGRILSVNMSALSLMRQGQRLVNGYRGGLEPRKQLDYLRLMPLRLSAAAWFCVCDRNLLASSPELASTDENWHAVTAPLPRFRLLGRAQVSDQPAADLERIDIETTALVTHPLRLKDGASGSVRCLREEPGDLTLHTEAPGRRLLVIAESYDPAWQVEIDGALQNVEQVNGDFLGCIVEPGTHEVHFGFRPASVYYGLRLSLIGLALTLLMACIIVTAAWLQRQTSAVR